MKKYLFAHVTIKTMLIEIEADSLIAAQNVLEATVKDIMQFKCTYVIQ